MTLRCATSDDSEPLFNLWLRSVRATHLFLTEEEIQSLVPYVREYLAGNWASFSVIEVDGTIVGFMGIHEGEIESLFIDPIFLRRGFGRQFVKLAQSLHATLTVSVNEQNPDACRFYEACGFQLVGRSETDDAGRPYTLLRMRWSVA